MGSAKRKTEFEVRPLSKKQKVDPLTVDKTHILDIQPLGNLILADDNAGKRSIEMRSNGLGYFGPWPDELILSFLQLLGPKDLRNLGYTSRIFSAFALQDDLWKHLFVRLVREMIPKKWYGTWRRTFYSIDELSEARFSCAGFYSDALYRPFYCSAVNISTYLSQFRNRHIDQKIQRFKKCPSQEEFDSKLAFEPFIIENFEWPRWKLTDLEAEFNDIEFQQECVQWPLKIYSEYMKSNSDESPLYLFDKNFARKTKLTDEYNVPEIFKTDYFTLLADIRPDYRWIIIGPERSGSTFHKDPNATSAWNAVVEGEKYWIMFPPNVLPPGVYTSEDESEVTSPLSIAEWLIEFHKGAIQKTEYLDGFCKAGEVLYVPSGWWHLVINITSTIALTQNFVPLPHVRNVLRFLKDRKEQISGFQRKVDAHSTNNIEYGMVKDDDETPDIDVYEFFLSKLRGLGSNELPVRELAKINDLASGSESASQWEKLVNEKETTFNFGFGFESENEEDEE
ncbi:hypothetical protein V1511DRAFT_477480 [Dipodascopsis uninucleata]